MFEIVSISNRALCKGDFISRLKGISSFSDEIILREKDLAKEEYFSLAKSLKEAGVNFTVHTHADVARELSIKKIHLSFENFLKLEMGDRQYFTCISVSCHSVKEALLSQEGGAGKIVAGHIFSTACKKDLPPRGINFLKEVCATVMVPVFAIGGINSQNAHLCAENGASGVCVMSGAMQCEDVESYFKNLREGI